MCYVGRPDMVQEPAIRGRQRAYVTSGLLKQWLPDADRGPNGFLILMRTLIAKAWPGSRRRRELQSCAPRALTARLASDAGLTLIEVLVASLITAIVAVGTLTGIDAADRSSADTRSVAQATQLAGQDQERLRGMTTGELDQLAPTTTTRAENGDCLEQVSGTWHYWSKTSTSFCESPPGLSGTAYTATAYTIESTAEYVSSETGSTSSNLTCETGSANYLRTSSLVTWTASGTHQVTQSSEITVPTSNTLKVKVLNQGAEPVGGATVKVVDGSSTITRTTPASGCVVLGGLPTTTAEVTATKANWVNYNTETSPPAKAVTVSKLATTEQKFYIAEPGEIAVKFVEATAGHGPVEGSTFYAFQTEVASPDGFVGGSASSFSTGATLKVALFPFKKITETPAGKYPYHVFAGDCEANNPSEVTGKNEAAEAQVEPNGTTTVSVPLPKVAITLDEGTKASPKGTISAVEHAMIVNVACASKTARTGTVPTQHEVTFSGGSLKQNYQPYAKELELCVVVHKGANYYKLEPTFANIKPEGISLTYYPEEGTKSTTAPTCP
jgi:prepilin-type N-terminal cleavage/methylation domain-containing protein